MKSFSKILMVILVIVFLAVAVIGFMDTPVAAEGEELTPVQVVIVKLKEYLSEALSAIGLSVDAVLLYLFTVINKTSSATSNNAQTTSAEIAGLKSTVTTGNTELKNVDNKTDILMEMFSEVLLLSDLPPAVRTKIADYKAAYDGVKDGKQILSATKSIVEKSNENVSVEEKSEFDATVNKIKDAISTAKNIKGAISDNIVSRF